MVKHSVEEAERMKGMPSPHYDVEEGSLSDDPGDLNHLRRVAEQFDRALGSTINQINSELDYLRGLSRRMMELTEKVYQEDRKRTP